MKRCNENGLHFEPVGVMPEEKAMYGENEPEQEEKPVTSPTKRSKEPVHPKLSESQVAELRELVDSVESGSKTELTKKDIADMFNIRPQYVNRYYNGEMKPKPDSLEQA